MAKKDFYEVLGVDRNIDQTELKKSYRRLAQKYHPDRNPDVSDAAERFKEINEAYDTLSNLEKRQMYDQHGHAAFEAGGFSSGFSETMDFGNAFNGIFENIFGMGGTQRRTSRKRTGANRLQTISINLQEAALGVELTVPVSVMASCSDCNGYGTESGEAPDICQQCQGAGEIHSSRGVFNISEACPVCRGAGRVIRSPCRTCGGQAQVKKQRDLSVTIPGGVDNGTRLRLANEGDSGLRGAPPGDLFIEISVLKHPIFTREGTHLFCDLPISFADACLGATYKIPTLQGRGDLKIPQGTQSGEIFRIRGKGVQSLRGGSPGDLLCRIDIETPIKLTKQQRKSLEAFRDSLGEGTSKHSPRISKWLKSVKGFLDGLKKSA